MIKIYIEWHFEKNEPVYSIAVKEDDVFVPTGIPSDMFWILRKKLKDKTVQNLTEKIAYEIE